jgi:hypothetical protein
MNILQVGTDKKPVKGAARYVIEKDLTNICAHCGILGDMRT